VWAPRAQLSLRGVAIARGGPALDDAAKSARVRNVACSARETVHALGIHRLVASWARGGVLHCREDRRSVRPVRASSRSRTKSAVPASTSSAWHAIGERSSDDTGRGTSAERPGEPSTQARKHPTAASRGSQTPVARATLVLVASTAVVRITDGRPSVARGSTPALCPRRVWRLRAPSVGG